METLFIIDSKKTFEGYALNTMTAGDEKVHYSQLTFEQYNIINGGGLIALSFEEFNNKFFQPYLECLQNKFEEITEDQFENALCELPPRRWTKEGNKEFFFCSECYTANIHACYLRVGKKYYSALRSISTPAAEIFNSIN